MLTAQQQQQLQDIPDGDWPIPAPVILAHGIAQQTAALARWSAAQIDAARAATLPSGRAYGQLGVRVHA